MGRTKSSYGADRTLTLKRLEVEQPNLPKIDVAAAQRDVYSLS
jgi:hypothetical protein